jgi:hypothetical protein
MTTLPEMEQRLRERLDALPKAARAELLHVLMLPDFDRAARIGEFWGEPRTRTFGELLIDCEEDRVASGCADRDVAGGRPDQLLATTAPWPTNGGAVSPRFRRWQDCRGRRAWVASLQILRTIVGAPLTLRVASPLSRG